MNKDNYLVNYINLDKRKDRNKNILKELEKVFDIEKISRVSAIEDNLGALGLVKSSLKILNNFIKSDKTFLFVFEDDIEWELKPYEVKKYLDGCLKTDFNILNISYHCPVIKFSGINNEYTSFATNIQMTSAYILRKSFAPILLKLFEESLNNMTKDNMHTYAIDQIWKRIQTQKDKFYVSKIRLAKQINDFSDIENKNVHYGSNAFVIILSCKKYMYKIEEHRKQMINSNFNYRYFIGDPTIDNPREEGDIVYLSCYDSYEKLPDKTYNALKWVKTNYPNINYIFKTDDDIKINFLNLYNLFQKLVLKKVNYAGNTVIVKDKSISNDHYNKCANKKINKRKYMLEKCIYNSGGLYFLSQLSIDIILRDFQKQKYVKYIYEDYRIGLVLNHNKISCVKVKHMKNYAEWENM